MGKVKLLLDVAGNLRSLADSLQAVADAVAENDSSAEMTATKESEEKSRTKAAAKKNTAKKDCKGRAGREASDVGGSPCGAGRKIPCGTHGRGKRTAE